MDINASGMKGIVVGDVDNNGYPDILKWRYYESSNHRLLLNFGNHHFDTVEYLDEDLKIAVPTLSFIASANSCSRSPYLFIK